MFGKGNTISKRSLESMYIEGHWLERGVLRMTLRLGVYGKRKREENLAGTNEELKEFGHIDI